MIRYREGFKYQLAEDYVGRVSIYVANVAETGYIRLQPGGHILIRNGYAWDGPSGPTIDTPSAMRGSLVHDALYQLIRLEKLPKSARKQADKEYRRICVEDGMSKFRASLHFDALRLFGGGSATPNAEKPILAAP